MQDSTSDISCTAPGGRRFKSTLRADRCFSRTTVLKTAVWIDAKREDQFLQADLSLYRTRAIPPCSCAHPAHSRVRYSPQTYQHLAKLQNHLSLVLLGFLF